MSFFFLGWKRRGGSQNVFSRADAGERKKGQKCVRSGGERRGNARSLAPRTPGEDISHLKRRKGKKSRPAVPKRTERGKSARSSHKKKKERGGTTPRLARGWDHLLKRGERIACRGVKVACR